MKKYRLEDISNGTRVYYEMSDGTILLALLMYSRLGWLNVWYIVNEDDSLTFVDFEEVCI